MFLEILSVAWSVYSSEPGELIATAIKCLRNEPRQCHSNVSGGFFFQVPLGFLQRPAMEKWSLMTVTVLLALTVRWTVSLSSYSGNTCLWSVK